MNHLSCHLLGQSQLVFNSQEVRLPYAKLNALLFYLLMHSTSTRDHLATLLWENKETAIARKNLRNSIYQINHHFGTEVIIKGRYDALTLNPQLVIENDAARFLENPQQYLELYQGNFLNDFYLKGCRAFQNWLEQTRFHLERVYQKSCYQMVSSAYQELPFEEAENYLLKLIALDEFEEDYYQLLMRLYLERDEKNKALKLYLHLVNLLDKELGIAPNLAIQRLYQTIIKQAPGLPSHQQPIEHYWEGRLTELQALEAFVMQAHQANSRVFFLQGIDGVGKKAIVERAIKNSSPPLYLKFISCMPLQAPGAVWEQIREYLAVEAGSRQQLIWIDQAQYMDEASLLSLEQALMAPSRQVSRLFLFTYNFYRNAALNMLKDHLLVQKAASYLRLDNFSGEACHAYLTSLEAVLPLSQEQREKMLDYSQGNPFILQEYLSYALAHPGQFTPITDRLRSKLALRLRQLTTAEERLLFYLSASPKGLSFHVLLDLLNLKKAELVELIDHLSDLGLLAQDDLGQQLMIAIHEKTLQLFIYEQLSPAKSRILHENIALSLSGKTSTYPHLDLLETIIYHYEQAKQPVKAISYRLQQLSAILENHYKLFPLAKQIEVKSMDPSLASQEDWVLGQFSTLKEQISDAQTTNQEAVGLEVLLLQFHYLKGSYYIRKGHYTKGLKAIYQVISSAKEQGMHDYLLKGYRQLIYYAIQTDNKSGDMQHYTELGLENAIEANDHEAIGTFLRLDGLYHFMVGDEAQATRRFHEAIDCFSLTMKMQEKYALQIASAIDYLAEIAQNREDWNTAINYQLDAIELTRHYPHEPSVVSFQISLGISYFYAQQFDKALAIFRQAKEAIRDFQLPWKEVQLNLYLSLLSCRLGDFTFVNGFLSQKEAFIAKYSNPRDIGMIYYLLATLSLHYASKVSKQVLTEDFLYYYHSAKQHLNPYRDKVLLRSLEALKVSFDQDK